jgi:hypothetical protein
LPAYIYNKKSSGKLLFLIQTSINVYEYNL